MIHPSLLLNVLEKHQIDKREEHHTEGKMIEDSFELSPCHYLMK